MGATRNTGYLENLIQYDASDNVAIATTVNPSYKVTLGGSMLGTSAVFSGNLSLQGAVTRNINFYDSSNTNINAQIQYDQISSNSGQLFFGTNNAGTFATRLTISNTGKATFSSDIQGGGDLYFNKATRTTIYPTTTNQNLHIKSNGTGTLQFNDDVTGNIAMVVGGGKVGIGTNSPASLLSIQRGASGDNMELIGSGANGYSDILFYNTNKVTRLGYIDWSDTQVRWNVEANLPLVLYTSGNPRMTITSGGNVGIGATSVTNTLQIGSTAYNNNDFAIGNGSVNFAIDLTATNTDIYSSGVLTFNTALTERMRITSGGNVGVATTDPKVKFEVAGFQTQNLRLYGLNGVEYNGLSSNIYYNGSVWTRDNGSYGAAVMHFGSDSSIITFNVTSSTSGYPPERMRITSGGLFKFQNNGSSYESSTSGVNEFNTAANDTNVVFRNTASTLNAARAGVDVFYANAAPNTTNASFYQAADNAGGRTLRFEVRSNGGIANYSANNVPLSDRRVKKEITPLESYWDKFKLIEMVKFKYKDQTHDDFNIGVISQQIQSIMPELVDVWDEENALENDSPLLGVYMEDIHNMTMKVLQEAMAKIELLEAKITLLENK